jgi:hypothetical protein
MCSINFPKLSEADSMVQKKVEILVHMYLYLCEMLCVDNLQTG